MARIRRPSNPVRVVEKEKKVPYKSFPHDEGEFTVGQGIHEIAVKTKNKVKVQAQKQPQAEEPGEEPLRVWICMEDTGEIPVCMGDLDKVSTSITEDGFIAHLEIHSTERLIKWYVEM